MAWPISQFERRSVQLSGMLGSVAARKTAFAGATNQKKTTGKASNNANNALKESHKPRLLLRMKNARRPVAASADGSSTRVGPTEHIVTSEV